MDVNDTAPATATADGPDVGQIDRTLLQPYAFMAPPAGSGFFVSMTAAARTAMQAHAGSQQDLEVGGVLLGRLWRPLGEDRAALLIDAIVPGLAAESKHANLTFTADAWTEIHATIDRDHPGATIVGWYHTHPNFGVFLSDMDVFIQRHFFDLPHQVAIVIDPIRQDEGVFTWQHGVPVRSPLHVEPSPDGTPDHADQGPSTEDRATPDLAALMRARHSARAFASAPRRWMGLIAEGFASLVEEFRGLNVAQRLALSLLLALMAIIFLALGYVASGNHVRDPRLSPDAPTRIDSTEQ